MPSIRFPVVFTLALFHCLVALAGETPAAQTPAQLTREAFLKIIDRPRVPLAAESKEMPSAEGTLMEKFSYAADAEQRVPGFLIKPAKAEGPRPVVIALHGTGGKKESNTALLKELVAKNFIGVAIDGRYHGERSKTGGGTADYYAAITRAYITGKEHPWLYDTVWDVLRLLDYLETRADVDAKRIGMIGFSKGGMETYLASAIELRIAVAIPCIGVQSYNWALENDAWKRRIGTVQAGAEGAARYDDVALDREFAYKFYNRVVPGIYKEFDGPAMLPLIAPRPLMVINGDSDTLTPVPGIMLCADAARRAYADAKSDEKFVLRIQEKTGHAVTPESRKLAIEWFVKWLAP